MPVVIRSLGLGLCAAKYCFSEHKQDNEVYPWIREHLENNASLCGVCTRLNIPWLFENPLYEYTVTDGSLTAALTDGIRLGPYPKVSKSTSCRFCQFLIHTLNYWADYDVIVDSDDWENRDVYIMNIAFNDTGIALDPNSKTGEYSMRLAVNLRPPNDELTISRFGDRNAMIQKLDAEPARLYRGLRLAENSSQMIDRINEWILPCIEKSSASEESLLTTTSPLSLRLIDTERACIVGPFVSRRYVALSYTWGKIDPLMLKQSNEHVLREDGALSRFEDKVPITIQNAIVLCSMLGQRYLWIDSLCIIQDGIDKQDQIQQMDRIYQEATLTIVAAAGKDANAGLPGVSASRQLAQRVIEIDGMHLSNVLPSCGTSLGASEWNWRGWTFQEGLLATRKLIFTVDQVYYHCPHGECSEDTSNDIHRSFELSRDSDFRLSISNVSNWTVYENVVATYCRRELSYESDALNAFAGIASYLSRSVFASSPFVTGIPLCSLEVGLLWQPSGRLRRRLDPKTNTPLFPSWSWVAWYGNLEYGDTSGLRNIFERSISHIRLLGVPEGLRTCKPPPSWKEWNKWQRKVVEGIDNDVYDIYYTHKDLPGDRWFAHPIDLSATEWLQTNLTWSELEIEAEIAKLIITGEHADLWYRSEECDEGNHEICRLQVFDQNGRKAGTVVMDGAMFEATDFEPDKLFSFIKISQTTLAFGREDPAWDDESKSFKGCPGEPALNSWPLLPKDEEAFDQEVYDRNICWCLYDVLVAKLDGDVAQRIAVGRVHIHAFDRSNPARTRIILR